MKPTKQLLAVGIVVAIVTLVFPAAAQKAAPLIWPTDSNALQKLANIGDAIGVLNTLFSGLAFAAVAVLLSKQQEALDSQTRTCQLQQEGLDLQREQFKLIVEGERQRKREDRTLWLAEVWHSPEMAMERTQASALVHSFTRSGNVLALSALEDLQVQNAHRIRNGMGDRPALEKEIAEASALFRVLFHFDLWARLKLKGAIDPDLALDLLAEPAAFYSSSYLEKVQERGQNWSVFVQRILQEVGNSAQARVARDSHAGLMPPGA